MITKTVGASLPDEIEVDDTAAYFGVIKSSDILHEMRQMDPHAALAAFIELTADLHLSEGEFDFEAASERMNCEGGEIYYLVVSHFGLTALSDPLRLFLGQEDSQGNHGSPCPLSAAEQASLNELCDAMTLLKLFSIGQMTAGPGMVVSYVRKIGSLMANAGANVPTLIEINNQLQAEISAASSGTMPQPIPELSALGAAVIPTSSGAQPSVPLPNSQPPPTPVAGSSPATTTSSKVQPTQSETIVIHNPSPAMVVATEPPIQQTESNTLPSPSSLQESEPQQPSSAAPSVEPSIPSIYTDTDAMTSRQLNAVAADAFGSAFGGELIPEPILEQAGKIQNFLTVDKNKDGRLDELEITDVVGDTAIAQERIIAADTDRDGTISLPEYLAQPDDIIKESSIEAKSAVSTTPSDVAEPKPESGPIHSSVDPTVEPIPEPILEQAGKIQNFLTVDKNKDGRLDEIEITDVVGDTAIAQERIIAADTDRDGTISLPEYLAQPDDIIKESSIEAKSAVSTTPSDVAEPTSASTTTQFSLPKPVAPVPVRKPIENLNTLSQGQSAGKGNQYSHVQQGAPSHPAVEPVIRSGIHCRGCKIGLDPHWRHCPICGSSQA